MSRSEMSPGVFVAFLLASATPDIVDVLYFAAGICSPYGLYSHTLIAVVLEAAIVGGVALLATGSCFVAFLFAVIVLLHLPADYFTGQKLFMPGGEMLGLRWYSRPLLDWLVEVPIVITGWWLLHRSGRVPRWVISVWALVFMLVIQTAFDSFASITSRGFKPNACPGISASVDVSAFGAGKRP